jgi:hypothetical protein
MEEEIVGVTSYDHFIPIIFCAVFSRIGIYNFIALSLTPAAPTICTFEGAKRRVFVTGKLLI